MDKNAGCVDKFGRQALFPKKRVNFELIFNFLNKVYFKDAKCYRKKRTTRIY